MALMNDAPLEEEPLGLIVERPVLAAGLSEDRTYLSDEAMQEFARQWNERHAQGHEYIILDGNATPVQLQQALKALGHPEDLEVRPLEQHQPHPKPYSMADEEWVLRTYAERHPEFQQLRFETSPASLDPAWEQVGLRDGIEHLEYKPDSIHSGELPFWASNGPIPVPFETTPAHLEYKPDLDAMTALARGLQAGRSVVLPSSALTVPGVKDMPLKFGKVVLDASLDASLSSANFDLALKASQLAAIEREVLDLQGNIERAQWGVVKLLTRIQEQDLFLAAYNEAEGRYYRSFSEYLPDVLAGWYQRGLISTDSVRQIRTYLRAQRIFLNPENGFALTREDITDLGITHFERLAEALDYDHETGRVAETPRAGKLGVAEASEVLDDIREGTYTVQDTRAKLDELRGVTRKNYSIDVRHVAGDYYELRRLMSWENGVGLDLLGGMSRLDLDRLCKALGIKEPHMVGG